MDQHLPDGGCHGKSVPKRGARPLKIGNPWVCGPTPRSQSRLDAAIRLDRNAPFVLCCRRYRVEAKSEQSHWGSNMRIIDRYLLRQFIETFVICFLSLVGLFIIFDLFTNLEEFVTCGRNAGGVLPFIAEYYMYQTILFFDRTGGVLALISAMFTVAWIQRHNEMTALMSAGVSRFRVLLPIIIAVAVVSLLLAANREILMPRYRHELSRRPQDPSGSKPQSLGSRYDGRTNVAAGRQMHLRRRQTDRGAEFLACRQTCTITAVNWPPTTPITNQPTNTIPADICLTACAGRRTSILSGHCG